MKRSRHLGVYHNYDNSHPYRVAIKKYVGEQVSYTNVGYFTDEEAAAWVYNIYALCSFGTGAIINNVILNDIIELEVEQYEQTHPGFDAMVEQAADTLEKGGERIKLNRH